MKSPAGMISAALSAESFQVSNRTAACSQSGGPFKGPPRRNYLTLVEADHGEAGMPERERLRPRATKRLRLRALDKPPTCARPPDEKKACGDTLTARVSD
jgi:hypothetical protein